MPVVYYGQQSGYYDHVRIVSSGLLVLGLVLAMDVTRSFLFV